MAVSRHRFFGRDVISFLVVLPIALPGIVTGMALNATFTRCSDVDLTLFTVIVGHATFCIVVVYNNAVARLRRTGMSLEEAASDLGAGPWRTFRDVTFPQMRTALVAGALLAFALSFDEIIVTTFHRRLRGDAADLDLHQLRAAQPAADRERGRAIGDPAVDHPRVPRQPALPGSDRGPGAAPAPR